MAEQLGEARLKVSADTAPLEAGLAKAKQAAQQTAQQFDAAFQGANAGPASNIRSIQSLQEKLQQLRGSYESVQIGSKGFQQLQREIQKTERELQQVDKTLGATFAQRAGGFGASLLGGLGLGVGVSAGAAIGGFLRSSIQEAVQLESVTRKLSNSLGQQGAAGALSFTKDLANSLGLNFKNLANSFGSFTAAATAANVPLETQRGLFAAVSRAGQALGLSNDEIQGSFVALQQIASKGVVSQEELRQQLGERLPIALSAAAKGLGITQQELGRLVDSGKLTAAQFFPALTKGLNELTSGAGGVPTAAQNFSKLANSWESLQQTFGQNLLPGITEGVKLLDEALQGVVVRIKSRDLQLKFGFSGEQADQLVGFIDTIQTKYSLTRQETEKLIASSIKLTGSQREQFNELSGLDAFNGRLNITSDGITKIQQNLPRLAADFRNQNQDQLAAANSQAALAKAAAERRAKEEADNQKILDIELRRNQTALDFRNLRDQIKTAQVAPNLNEDQERRLQAEIALQQKLREIQADRLLLQRELAKPQGTGDGKPLSSGAPTQNAQTIEALQNKIGQGELQVQAQQAQNRNAEREALQNRRESLGLLQLQLKALREGPNSIVSPTDELKVKLANQSVRDAYRDAGRSLVDNARAAAQSLRGAQEARDSAQRSAFKFLTPELREAVLARARASVQTAVDRGLIRTGIPIGTPQQLFQVAGVAESLINTQTAFEKALAENVAATNLLVQKDWNVIVQLPNQAPAPLPLQPA